MQGAERGARGPAGKTAWKTHIIRQLRHRDRTQQAFQELIQSYHKLLEKSVFLKDLTEKIQTEPILSPGSHHAARLLPEGPHIACSADPPTLQQEILELRIYNGELAYQACELKKGVQERDEELKRQESSISFLAAQVEEHRYECERLQSEKAEMEHSNTDLKEGYDQLLAQRHLLEGKLHDEEEKAQELIGAITTKKAMEAEHQNNANERKKKDMWRRFISKALNQTVTAEGDIRQRRHATLCDSRSLEMSTGTQEIESPVCRRTRSQSMISLGPSRVMGALRSLFDFRRQQADSSMDDDCYHPSSVCVICGPPKTALYSKEIHDSEIHAVKFSPSSTMVATGGADRVVKIWGVVGGQLHCQQVLQGSNGGITSIDFDSSGTQLLAASYDGSAHLWRLDTKSSEKLTGHTAKVTAARFKMSSYKAVTCSMDRTVREWDLQRASCIRQIRVPSYCSDVVCSDFYMISGHHDKKIRFWDSRSRHCSHEVALEEKVTSLYMEQEQTQLLSCSRDDALHLLDLRTMSVRLAFRAQGFKCGCDWTKAILSPDTSYSMAGSSDGSIYIWNARNGGLERSLTGEHSAAVNAVAWSVSGDYVISVDRGKRAVLWSEY